MIAKLPAGFFLAIFAALLWAFLPLNLKWAMQYMDPVTLTWFRFTLAFTVMIALRSARGRGFSRKILRPNLFFLIGLSTISLLSNYLLNLFGLSKIAPTDNQILIQLGPIFLGLGGLFVFGESYTKHQWHGVGVLGIGLALFLNDQISAFYSHLANYLEGTLLIVLAALAWASYAITSKQILKQVSSSELLTLIYLGGAFIFLPWANPCAPFHLSKGALVIVLLTGFNTVFAYGAFSKALETWEASKVSAVLTMTPLITFLFTQIAHAAYPDQLTADRLGPVAIVGAMLVVAGSLRVALWGKRKVPTG